MSNVTNLFSSYSSAQPPSPDRSRTQPPSTVLSAELRAGLDELKKEFETFRKSEQRP